MCVAKFSLLCLCRREFSTEFGRFSVSIRIIAAAGACRERTQHSQVQAIRQLRSCLRCKRQPPQNAHAEQMEDRRTRTFLGSYSFIHPPASLPYIRSRLFAEFSLYSPQPAYLLRWRGKLSLGSKVKGVSLQLNLSHRLTDCNCRSVEHLFRAAARLLHSARVQPHRNHRCGRRILGERARPRENRWRLWQPVISLII